jgi:hypothetical protein
MVRGKDRNLSGVGLTRKEGGRKAASSQNQFGGGRYGIGEEMKDGTQRAIQKAQDEKKHKGDIVVIDPVKPDAIGQTYN